MVETEKTCTVCGQRKPATEEYFYRRSGRSSHLLHAFCRDCWSAKAKARYEKSPETTKLRSRQWGEANRERKRAADRAYGAIPEVRAKKRARSNAWDAEHRDVAAARTRKWAKDHPLEASAQAHTKRCRKRGVPGVHTALDVRRIYKEQEGLCYYCEVPLNGVYHKDHKVPISRPECHPTNWPSNIALACAPCNIRKHDMTDGEYRAFLRRGLRAVKKGAD